MGISPAAFFVHICVCDVICVVCRPGYVPPEEREVFESAGRKWVPATASDNHQQMGVVCLLFSPALLLSFCLCAQV